MAFTGCRPLTSEEQEQVYDALDDKRDKALFTLQLKCGFRISELLSLHVRDVCSLDEKRGISVFAFVKVQRRNAKKKTSGRMVPLNRKAQQHLHAWIQQAKLNADDYLFPPWSSRHKTRLNVSKSMHYHSALRIYKVAFAKSGIAGPAYSLGTHCGRKCFAKKMKDKLGNIEDVQKAMGHESIASTQHYLKFDSDRIHQAILDDD